MQNKQINPTGNNAGLIFSFAGCASGLFKSLQFFHISLRICNEQAVIVRHGWNS